MKRRIALGIAATFFVTVFFLGPDALIALVTA